MQIKGLCSAVHLLNPTVSAHIATSIATSAKLFNPPTNSSRREAGLTRVGFISCWDWFCKAQAEKASKSLVCFNPPHRILCGRFCRLSIHHTFSQSFLLYVSQPVPSHGEITRRLFNSPSGESSSMSCDDWMPGNSFAHFCLKYCPERFVCK